MNNSNKERPTSEDDSRSGGRRIPWILWIPKVHFLRSKQPATQHKTCIKTPTVESVTGAWTIWVSTDTHTAVVNKKLTHKEQTAWN
jgi:hypothetical protein